MQCTARNQSIIVISQNCMQGTHNLMYTRSTESLLRNRADSGFDTGLFFLTCNPGPLNKYTICVRVQHYIYIANQIGIVKQGHPGSIKQSHSLSHYSKQPSPYNTTYSATPVYEALSYRCERYQTYTSCSNRYWLMLWSGATTSSHLDICTDRDAHTPEIKNCR